MSARQKMYTNEPDVTVKSLVTFDTGLMFPVSYCIKVGAIGGSQERALLYSTTVQEDSCKYVI